MATGVAPVSARSREKMVKRIVELAKGKYRGFNDRHLTEKLKEQEQIELSREKIRRILRFHGIASPRKGRANQHRSRRDRRAAEGMMLQVDGSPHDWLEGRGPALCLIGAIDDAVLGARFGARLFLRRVLQQLSLRAAPRHRLIASLWKLASRSQLTREKFALTVSPYRFHPCPAIPWRYHPNGYSGPSGNVLDPSDSTADP